MMREGVYRGKAHPGLGRLLSDVLVPHFGACGYEFGEQVFAFLRVQVYDFDPVLPQPVDASGEGIGLAHDDRAYLELSHEPAAIPAWRERRNHNGVAVIGLPP